MNGTVENLSVLLRPWRKTPPVVLAARLMARFDTLRGLRDAARVDLVNEVGQGNANRIKAVLALGVEATSERLPVKVGYHCSKEIYKYVGPSLRHEPTEHFRGLFLDSRNHIVHEQEIAVGGRNGCPVNPRDAFRLAVREGAASVIFVHNHPAGDPTPSREDLEITKRLSEAGELLGVKVLDHIIIGDGRYLSLVDMGYMK